MNDNNSQMENPDILAIQNDKGAKDQIMDVRKKNIF